MSRIKVLPVYPRFPTTFWGFQYALPYIGKKSSMPPTGLATVIADPLLPEDKFEAQKIVDLNVEPLKDEQLDSADLIFLSSMLIQEPSHNEVVARAHARGKKVVSGGPFPTTYPERTNDADFLVGGEAEVTLPVFLEDFLRGEAQRSYTEESVRGRSQAELTKTGKVSVTQTPLPRWDLLNLRDYSSAAIQYSRGCPFNCEFCDITKLFGREPRTKTPEQMVSELNALYDSGHRGSVFIVDDNFIGNRDNVRILLPVVADWQRKKDFPFQFFTEASMDLAWDSNKDILEGMAEAGFDSVFLGIESTDPNVLKAMKKGQNTKLSQLESVRRIQKAGLEVMGGFIIGSDGEKVEAPERLFEFIQEAGIPIAMPGLLTAIRGTDLYERLSGEGRIRGDSKGNNTHFLGFNFEPQQDERALLEGYKFLISNLFNPKNYYARCRTLQEHREPRYQHDRASPEGVMAFVKSLKQLFSRGGLDYARHVFGTAVTNPKQFPEAVAQAIKLDHFKKITDATLEADAYAPEAESLAERFRERAARIYENGKRDIGERLENISTAGKRVLAKAERKYHELHHDFRSVAEQALHRLNETIRSTINSYRESSVSARSK